MLDVQTEKIVLLLDNKIKFCSAVLRFGSRSMEALSIINQCSHKLLQ